MDPNEALKNVRQMVKNPGCPDDVREAFEALDIWLSKGGFLPEDWQGY